MKGIGLVFSGGGGKGAYEIGVWKYLHEIGLDQYVKAVSGTSVGALNAAMFVGSTYDNAEKIWNEIRPADILPPHTLKLKEKYDNRHGYEKQIADILKPNSDEVYTNVNEDICVDDSISRKKMEEIIYKGIDINKIRNSSIPCYVTCLRSPKLEVERFKLNDYEIEDIVKLLLASSAMPVFISPSIEFNGCYYRDGGIEVFGIGGDNTPVQPVYDMGLEYIFVIYLDINAMVNKKEYPNSKIIEIRPSFELSKKNIGTQEVEYETPIGKIFDGSLEFGHKKIIELIDLGYEDTKRLLQPMLDNIIMSVQNKKILKEMINKEAKFQKQRESLLLEEKRIFDEMETDGFDDLYNRVVKRR